MSINLSLTSSDWITIAFTFISVLLGFFISWLFFRAQQQTDFKLLKEEIASLNSKLDPNDISIILKIVEKIDDDLSKSISTILNDLGKEQRSLSRRIQKKFSEQSEESRKVIEDSFRREITSFLPATGQTEVLLSKLVDSFMGAMQRMGEYQKLNIENQSEQHLVTIKRVIESEIREVVQEVEELKNKVDHALVPYKK